MGVLWTWSRVGGGEKKGGKVAQREWAQRWMLGGERRGRGRAERERPAQWKGCGGRTRDAPVVPTSRCPADGVAEAAEGRRRVWPPASAIKVHNLGTRPGTKRLRAVTYPSISL